MGLTGHPTGLGGSSLEFKYRYRYDTGTVKTAVRSERHGHNDNNIVVKHLHRFMTSYRQRGVPCSPVFFVAPCCIHLGTYCNTGFVEPILAAIAAPTVAVIKAPTAAAFSAPTHQLQRRLINCSADCSCRVAAPNTAVTAAVSALRTANRSTDWLCNADGRCSVAAARGSDCSADGRRRVVAAIAVPTAGAALQKIKSNNNIQQH